MARPKGAERRTTRSPIASLLLQWADLPIGRCNRPVTRMHAYAPCPRTRLIHTAGQFRTGELMSGRATISAGLQFIGASTPKKSIPRNHSVRLSMTRAPFLRCKIIMLRQIQDNSILPRRRVLAAGTYLGILTQGPTLGFLRLCFVRNDRADAAAAVCRPGAFLPEVARHLTQEDGVGHLWACGRVDDSTSCTAAQRPPPLTPGLCREACAANFAPEAAVSRRCDPDTEPERACLPFTTNDTVAAPIGSSGLSPALPNLRRSFTLAQVLLQILLKYGRSQRLGLSSESCQLKSRCLSRPFALLS